jgi:Leucine Rich repeat
MPTMTMRPRRKRQLSVRLAMVMIVLLAIPLARLAVRARAQKEAVLAISQAGGFVGYDWEFLPDGRINASPKPPGQSWIHKWLGPDYFQTVERVLLQRDDNGDDLMEHVGKLEGLRTISITGTKITDAGIAHLAGLSRLRVVYLQWDIHLTGACLVHLRDKKELTRMTTLNLSGTSITDQGLVHLRALGSLAIVNPAGTRVTNQGIAESKTAATIQVSTGSSE